MKILGLILAREGSKRLPGKNRLSLGGTKLVDFAIEAMKETPEITNHAISTDDEGLGVHCHDQYVDWIRRPPGLCTDTSDIREAIEHAFKLYRSVYIVSFQCAVPLRPVGSTSTLIQEVIRSGANGGLSVIKRTPWMWNIDINKDIGVAAKEWTDDDYPRSQDLPYETYEEINSIQVTHKSMIGKRWGYPLSFVELPSWADFDIDDQEDYEKCQRMWEFIKDEYYEQRKYKTFTIRGEI